MDRIKQELENGGAVVLPTETVLRRNEMLRNLRETDVKASQ